MHDNGFAFMFLIRANYCICHGALVPAFVNREPASLQALELSGFLHSNFLPYRSYGSLDVLRSHYGLCLHLIDHILDELAPLHETIPIYVDLFE